MSKKPGEPGYVKFTEVDDWDEHTPEDQEWILMKLDIAERGMDQEFPFARPIPLPAALEYLAMCIANHGPQYLPLYERIEAEIAARAVKETALEKALRLAAKPR